MKNKVMAWVDALPNVAGTAFQAKRDEISKIVAEADALEVEAAELREQAYFSSLKLESDARSVWSYSEIEQAKLIECS